MDMRCSHSWDNISKALHRHKKIKRSPRRLTFFPTFRRIRSVGHNSSLTKCSWIKYQKYELREFIQWNIQWKSLQKYVRFYNSTLRPQVHDKKERTHAALTAVQLLWKLVTVKEINSFSFEHPWYLVSKLLPSSQVDVFQCTKQTWKEKAMLSLAFIYPISSDNVLFWMEWTGILLFTSTSE